MSREIKFRAWYKPEQKMYPVKDMHFDTEGTLYGTTLVGPSFFLDGYARDIELMQFTGIYDKRGFEIYEGDILRITGLYGNEQYATVIWGPVKNFYTWMNGETWLLRFSDETETPLYPYCQSSSSYKVRIAGNIYESKPEQGSESEA